MSRSKVINCLDIGTSKITTLICSPPTDGDKINVIAVATAPALGFRKGQVVDLELATHSITQSVESAERMAGFQISEVVVCLAAPHFESMNSRGVVAITQPQSEIKSADIQRAIEASRAIALPTGKEIIHSIPRFYIVDGQEGVTDPIGMSSNRLEVESHLILASTPGLKNINKCLDEVGLHPLSITFSGLTASDLVLTQTEKELGVVLVDIGGQITTINVFFEGSPIYTSVIPVGGTNVTNDLAIGLRLSIDEAEKIKTRLQIITEKQNFADETSLEDFGITGDSNRKISIQTAINGIIKPRLEELFSLIATELENSGLAGKTPAGMVITGGGSQTIQTKETATRLIPLPVRFSSPPPIGGLIEEVSQPGYTSTIGLAKYFLGQKITSSTKRTPAKISFNGIFGRFKSLIEPFLP
jgi:cell division protein FtsA